MTRHALQNETDPHTRLEERPNQALEAFVAAKSEIDTVLDRLAALSADHFEIHANEVNWGHVGTLRH